MTPYKNRKCKLTQRLAEDMMIRNMADSSIDAYTHTISVPWPVTMVPFGKRPRTLPTVLGRNTSFDT